MEIARFYRDDPLAPKPNHRTHLGANGILTWNGRLLLEKRRDSDLWGLIGGGVKSWETEEQAMAREVYEELGLRIRPQAFRRLKVYGEPGRIAAFRDGTVWRMVIVVFGLEFPEKPELRISEESRALRFFSPEELRHVPIAVTHSDIVEEQFLHIR